MPLPRNIMNVHAAFVVQAANEHFCLHNSHDRTHSSLFLFFHVSFAAPLRIAPHIPLRGNQAEMSNSSTADPLPASFQDGIYELFPLTPHPFAAQRSQEQPESPKEDGYSLTPASQEQSITPLPASTSSSQQVIQTPSTPKLHPLGHS